MRTFVERWLKPLDKPTVLRGIEVERGRPVSIETSLAPPFEVIANISRDELWLEQGYSFFASMMATIPSNQKTAYMFETPLDKTIYFTDLYISTDAEKVQCDLIKNATPGLRGVSIDIHNRNFGSEELSGCTLHANSTFTGGTVIPIDYLGGGTFVGNSHLGTIGESHDDLILKPGDTYFFVITNKGSTSVSLIVKGTWFELPRV